MRYWSVWLGSWLALLVPGSLPADVLEFRRGGRVDLPATIRGDSVVIHGPTGTRTFPRSAFRSITPGGGFAAEWSTRRAAVGSDAGASAWFALGWWALERGGIDEARDAFGVARSRPDAAAHAPLGRVVRMLDRLDARRSPPDGASLRAVLGDGSWSLLAGRQVVLIHQAEAIEDARRRLAVLDAAAESFYLSLAAQGFALRVPVDRPLSVWFARRDDYVEALARIDAAPFRNTQGFTHPTSNVVFAFDTRSDPDQAEARRGLPAGLERSGHRLDAESAVDRDRRLLLLDLRWLAVDLGIAAHETVHQFVAASGLAPHAEDFPNWLHEGLAAQFEVVRDGRWAGIGRRNDLRLPDWRPAPLPPLLLDNGLTHGYHRDRYAQAWSLVYFLRKTRPDEFATFLELLRVPHPPGQAPPVADPFRVAFGPDLDALQDQWHRFCRDANAPEVNPVAAGSPKISRR